VGPAGAWPAELVGVAQPATRWERARRPQVRAAGSRVRNVAGSCCTTRRRNAHRTECAEEREVFYPWHPWAGCVVRAHEVIEKPAGDVVRCARDASTARWQELPAWMFDRLACLSIRLTTQPRVDLGPLLALRTLLVRTAGGDAGGRPSSHAPFSGAARDSCDQKRRDAHATSEQPFRAAAGSSPTRRAVRPTPHRRGFAVVADASRGDASGGDEPDGTAHPRGRLPGSRPRPDGGSR
jgi:hypothetical protein